MDNNGTIVTVGTFDGMHRGHRRLLDELKRHAAALGLRPLAVTFDRHPLETIAPDRAPGLLTSAAERDALLRGAGVEVLVIPFTDGIRRLTVAEWMRKLRDDYGARAILMGYDNRFGSDGRTMSEADYRAEACALGLGIEFAGEQAGCSSTNVRRALAAGDIAAAGDILGRAFSVEGDVVAGRGLGRTIGVPTANVEVDPRRLLPRPGVYAAFAMAGDVRRKAVVNIGTCPTVTDGRRTTVEAHLLDFDGDLYGRTLTLRFVTRLRDERKFNGIDELTAQIASDIVAARGLLDSPEMQDVK